MLLLATISASAQCTLQLSDQGVIHLKSGQQRTLSWNAVPGAVSYLHEELIQSLGDPASPDFAFGAPYTESRNGEGKGLTSVVIEHQVLYKITFHEFVTALNRENPAFQPCKADVIYVVDPDDEAASIASRRIVPLAGKTHGMNGSDYTTALVIAGTGIGAGTIGATEKLYQGRIYFRPLGSRADDNNDPSIPYALNGDETLVYDDVMAQLGASGIGTIEIIPRVGFPTPQADAIVENRLSDGKRVGVRIPAAWGRDQLLRGDTITVGIRNNTDTRLSIGVRGYGGLGGAVLFQHLAADGTQLETVQRQATGNTTLLYSLQSLFNTPLHAADRVIARYLSVSFGGNPDLPVEFEDSKGVLLFLSETGNDLNSPNVIYRDSVDNPHFSRGFDRFVVY
jgi:hypothetical protein